MPRIIKNSACVLSVYFDELKMGWEQWFWLIGDQHHDSKYTNRKLETRHLDQARERGALVISCGDTFDAMQGKFDPRRSMDELRPEFRDSAYYDLIVRDAVDYYAAYGDNLLLFGLGNHETSVIDKVGTNLLDRMVYDLNGKAKSQVHTGGYSGWVRIMLNSGKQHHINIRYNHGFGKSAPVSHGVLDTARQATYLPDADVVINGHNHEAYDFPIARERLSERGIVSRDICWFARTPGYKQPEPNARMGFDIEKIPAPKPNGGVWMRAWLENHKIRMSLTQDIE